MLFKICVWLFYLKNDRTDNGQICDEPKNSSGATQNEAAGHMRLADHTLGSPESSHSSFVIAVSHAHLRPFSHDEGLLFTVFHTLRAIE